MADSKAFVELTKEKIQYDENAKTLLADKKILSNILIHTVEDFYGKDASEVEKLIEDDISIGQTPVDPGFTNEKTAVERPVITGMNTEIRVCNEGVTYFDLLFYVRGTDGHSKIIINLEAQKDEPSEYDVEMRGIYYSAREISAQLGREFTNERYNDIKKVYSIWICMNTGKNTLEHITLAKRDLIGKSRWKSMYELLHVVIIRLEKQLDQDKSHRLHRFLGALFLPKLTMAEKEEILEKEYNVNLEDGRKELKKSVCNLSEGIWECGVEEGMQKGTEQMLLHGKNVILKLVQDGKISCEAGAEALQMLEVFPTEQVTELGQAVKDQQGRILADE